MTRGWTSTSLGEVCNFEKAMHDGSAKPYVGLEDIEGSTGVFLGPSEPRAVMSNTFAFNRNHILYGRLRPYLNKVMLPEFDGHCSTEIFPILLKRRVIPKFLFYWLIMEQTVNDINSTCTGARMPRANMDAVLEFRFRFPSLPEQKRIVAILDEAFAGIDSAIENAEKNVKNSKDLFDVSSTRIFRANLSEWCRSPLGDLIDIKHGFAFDGEYFARKGKYVLLTPGNFFEVGGYRDQGEKQKYYTGDIPDGYTLMKGDFLFAMTEQAAGLLGSVVIVPEDNKFLHNQRLGLALVKPGRPWDNNFFFYLTKTATFRDAAHRSASGLKVRHTSPTKLREILVAYPQTLSEQKRISAHLDEIFAHSVRLQEIYDAKRGALSALKQSLLYRAFAGELTATPDRLLEAAVA